MSTMTINIAATNWRTELPNLTARLVTLREPTPQDFSPLVDLLSGPDATRFGIEDSNIEVGTQLLIERAARERATGQSFTYAIATGGSRSPIGLIQVRRL